MATWLRENLADALVRRREAAFGQDGTAWVAQAWVRLRLRQRMRASSPLGGLGEMGLEAG
jgi:hypothetical protein